MVEKLKFYKLDKLYLVEVLKNGVVWNKLHSVESCRKSMPFMKSPPIVMRSGTSQNYTIVSKNSSKVGRFLSHGNKL